MIVEFDKSFEKSIDKLKDKTLFPKIEKFIASLESVKALSELSNVKKELKYCLNSQSLIKFISSPKTNIKYMMKTRQSQRILRQIKREVIMI